MPSVTLMLLGPGVSSQKPTSKMLSGLLPFVSRIMACSVSFRRVYITLAVAMPMRCSGSCRTFETLSFSLEWIAQKKLKIDHIIHLLDDFLIITPSQKLYQGQLHLFIDLCSYLGILIAPERTCGPATTLSPQHFLASN